MPSIDSESSAPSAHLDVVGPNGETSRIGLTASPMIVGRVAECAIRLDHAMVSRQHARFERRDGRWRIVDLQSHNGIRLNNFAVRDDLLKTGDVIEIGPFRLTFHHRSPLAAKLASKREDLQTTLSVNDSIVSIRTLREIQPPVIAVGHLNGLDEFSRLLLDTPDADERLTALCRLMVQSAFGGKWSAVVSVDKTAGETSARVVSPLQFTDGTRRDLASPYLSRSLLQAARSRVEPVLASNAPGSGVGDIALSIAPDVMQLAAIAVPLPPSPSQDASQLHLLYAVFPPQYGTGEWLALTSLAVNHYRQSETIWANIERNCKLAALEADLERARVVQDRLVPKEAKLPGLDIAIRFKPCHAVGGDYVDVLALPDGRALLVIADVCGKGLAAAMVAMGLHTLVHAAARRWSSLADLAATASAHLIESLSSSSFVTLIAMTLDPTTGAIEVINGGHSASLVLDNAGVPRRFGAATATPLGAFPIVPDVEHGTLADGETMILFTDGCLDVVTDSGEMLGEDGFCQQATTGFAAGPIPIATAADGLTQALDHLQGNRPQGDDRTLLMVRRV